MSDENPTVDESQVEAPQVPEQSGVSVDELQAQLEALRAQNEELKPLADAARQAEEAQKTELQKLQEAQAEKDKKVFELEAENTRLRLAQVYGLAEEDLNLLGTGSSEQMEANAKRLQELHAAATKADSAPSLRPVDSMKPGNSEKKSAEDAAYPAHWAV